MHMLIKNVKIITPYEVLIGFGVKIKDNKIIDIPKETKICCCIRVGLK